MALRKNSSKGFYPKSVIVLLAVHWIVCVSGSHSITSHRAESVPPSRPKRGLPKAADLFARLQQLNLQYRRSVDEQKHSKVEAVKRRRSDDTFDRLATVKRRRSDDTFDRLATVNRRGSDDTFDRHPIKRTSSERTPAFPRKSSALIPAFPRKSSALTPALPRKPRAISEFFGPSGQPISSPTEPESDDSDVDTVDSDVDTVDGARLVSRLTDAAYEVEVCNAFTVTLDKKCSLKIKRNVFRTNRPLDPTFTVSTSSLGIDIKCDLLSTSASFATVKRLVARAVPYNCNLTGGAIRKSPREYQLMEHAPRPLLEGRELVEYQQEACRSATLVSTPTESGGCNVLVSCHSSPNDKNAGNGQQKPWMNDPYFTVFNLSPQSSTPDSAAPPELHVVCLHDALPAQRAEGPDDEDEHAEGTEDDGEGGVDTIIPVDLPCPKLLAYQEVIQYVTCFGTFTLEKESLHYPEMIKKKPPIFSLPGLFRGLPFQKGKWNQLEKQKKLFRVTN